MDAGVSFDLTLKGTLSFPGVVMENMRVRSGVHGVHGVHGGCSWDGSLRAG